MQRRCSIYANFPRSGSKLASLLLIERVAAILSEVLSPDSRTNSEWNSGNSTILRFRRFRAAVNRTHRLGEISAFHILLVTFNKVARVSRAKWISVCLIECRGAERIKLNAEADTSGKCQFVDFLTPLVTRHSAELPRVVPR